MSTGWKPAAGDTLTAMPFAVIFLMWSNFGLKDEGWWRILDWTAKCGLEIDHATPLKLGKERVHSKTSVCLTYLRHPCFPRFRLCFHAKSRSMSYPRTLSPCWSNPAILTVYLGCLPARVCGQSEGGEMGRDSSIRSWLAEGRIHLLHVLNWLQPFVATCFKSMAFVFSPDYGINDLL